MRKKHSSKPKTKVELRVIPAVPLIGNADPIQTLTSMGFRPKYTELYSDDTWHIQGSFDIRTGLHKVSNNLMVYLYHDITGAKRNLKFFQIPTMQTMQSREQRLVKRVDAKKIWRLAKNPKPKRPRKENIFTKKFIKKCSNEYSEAVKRVPKPRESRIALENEIKLAEALERQKYGLTAEEPYVKFQRHIKKMQKSTEESAQGDSNSTQTVSPQRIEGGQSEAEIKDILTILNEQKQLKDKSEKRPKERRCLLVSRSKLRFSKKK